MDSMKVNLFLLIYLHRPSTRQKSLHHSNMTKVDGHHESGVSILQDIKLISAAGGSTVMLEMSIRHPTHRHHSWRIRPLAVSTIRWIHVDAMVAHIRQTALTPHLT